jgi:hypothetical protein
VLTVGTLGVGIMDSMAFSLLANSNSKVNRNQISFGTVDFQLHPPTLTPVFANLDQEMDLTIGSLNFLRRIFGFNSPLRFDKIGSIGKQNRDNCNVKKKGSSSEVNSPVSFATTENIGGKIEELDETMDNHALGDHSEDLMICYNDTSDKSTDTWKTGFELHEDNQTTLSSCSSKFDNQYQVLAIVEDNSEEFDNNNNNPVLNPTNVTRGANHLAEGDTPDSLANKVKVRLSVDEGLTRQMS